MNVLIINGHPDRESLETSAAIAYRDAAVHAAENVDQITISELKKQPGSRNIERDELEKARKKIMDADHLVWVHPSLKSGFPAGTAVFAQMLFSKSKMYKGKSARIITSMEEDGWKYRLLKGRQLINRLKKGVLEKAGIYNVSVLNLGYVKNAGKAEQSELLRKVARLGQGLK
ncbi:MAG: NAD(P)H-dependent oxidoreductase [Balneolia bacterium]|nr:NAD(P)H-dependent oxidoreductase [Balneolia bacterium]